MLCKSVIISWLCLIRMKSETSDTKLAPSSVARGGGGGGGGGGRGGLEQYAKWLVKYAKSHVFCNFEADFL